MADASSVELDHCRELALIHGSMFEFTSRFVQKTTLERLLALYALRQAICTIPDSAADDSVKWTRLKWWSEELIAEPGAPQRHPVLRALWTSGARAHLDNSLLLSMVGDALSEIDAPPDQDESTFFDRQAGLGATDIQLELALDDSDTDSQSLGFLGAATASFRFISSFQGYRCAGVTRLPLSMLAEHNVSVEQLKQESHKSTLIRIIEQLAGNALDWYSKGYGGLNADQPGPASTHLQLRLALENRRLKTIRRSATEFMESGRIFGPADAWFAWRFLRKLR